MKKGQTCNANFFNRWLNYKIEKLREIERLCSAIMDVLQIAEKPSWYGIRAKETGKGDCTEKKHSPAKGIDWGNIFDKKERGEKVVEYTDFRQWYAMILEAGPAFMRVFYKNDDLVKDDLDHPLWIQIPFPYGDNIDSFQTIRDDCKMLSQLLESKDTAYDEQDFKGIENTVNSFIQYAFTLIGIHDKEYQITPKLREYEMQEQERKKADEIMREGRAKGGGASSKNVAILEAVKEFIIENRQRSGQQATTIARSFKREYNSSQPLEITVGSIKYEIYCDGKRVWSQSATGK